MKLQAQALSLALILSSSTISYSQEITLIPGDNFRPIPYLLVKSSPNPNPNPPNPIPSYSSEELRILEMSRLLSSNSDLKTIIENYKKYQKLCSQATNPPQIGMTLDQARASTWCFPETRNKTITSHGEYVQEVYKNPGSSKYAQYLYFKNNILVSIQE